MNDYDKLKKEVEELKAWKKSLEASHSIPLNVDQAIRARFIKDDSNISGTQKVLNGTPTTAGGFSQAGLMLGIGAAGIYFGSGAPTINAPQGSIYLRTDGSSTTTRAYVAQNSSGSWISFVTSF